MIVRGDTTTTLAGALAVFWRQIPVVHLEAGLRSGDLESPFPEEGNRKLVGQLAALHLAPTPLAATNLLDEGVPANRVVLTGNTIVDAALTVVGQKPQLDDELEAFAGAGRLVLVTAHRRESWGEPLDRVLAAVRILLNHYPDLRVVLPCHPNPAVRAQVEAGLAGQPRAVVTDPLPYPALARLLSEAYLVLTDSGGIQEEAPSFGVPALVLREVTERVESLAAGCARLVGTDPALIVAEAMRLLDDRAARDAMTAAGKDDVLAAKVPVLWMYDNIWQLTARSAGLGAHCQAAYGFTWKQVDFSTVGEVRYNGTSLTRDTINGSGIMDHVITDPAKVTVSARRCAPNRRPRSRSMCTSRWAPMGR